MKGLIAWFAENGVAANLVVAVILVGGLLTAPRIKQEVFPEFATDLVTVAVTYAGAAPEEIEESINVRVEEKVAGLEGVKRISSTATEGAGAVTVEALPGFDIRALLDDVKSQVDTIDTFPEHADEPIVSQVDVRYQVITVAVYGEADEKTLKRVGEHVRDEIAALDEVSLVELTGARPYEISIEVSEASLRRHGLTFDDVARAVRRSSLDLPGGSLRTLSGEILVRAKGQAYTGVDFERLVLLTRRDGTRLLLGDVADVRDAFAETDQSARFDGRAAVMVQVYRVGQQSAIAVAGAVRDYVATAEAALPEGVRLTTWSDRSRLLQSRLDTLRRNGLQGLALVFLTLALFLQFRLALWVSFGIPLSFLGTLWLMPTLGVSINVLSLFSFILVLGIVVDDAIVIGENVFKHREEGGEALSSAVLGAQGVSVPVIFGVLTTVVAFVPMLFMPGTTGRVMTTFPLVVIPTLLFSLVESQLVLPSHLKHIVVESVPAGGLAGLWYRVQGFFTGRLAWFVRHVYTPSLEVALDWRYSVLAAGVAALMVTLAVIGSGRLRLTFFPEVEADNVIALLTMPQGTPPEVTADALLRLESSAMRVRDELDAEGVTREGSAVRHALLSVGEQPFATAQTRNGGRVGTAFIGTHLGEVNLELAPSEQRSFDSAELARRWREATGPIPDAVELTFSSSLFDGGAAVGIRFASENIDHLRAAADRLKLALAAYPGVSAVADSFRPGKQELELAIKPRAEALGLSLADLAEQVRQGFYGEEAQRVQRGREDIKVMVRYPERDRRSLATLENMRVRVPAADGSGTIEVPFSQVATVVSGRGYATIQRSDRRRVVDVTADVDAVAGNANEIVADLKRTVLPQILSDYRGLSYTLEGEQREQRDTLGSLARGFAVALLVIYALMAVPLRSYLHPLIVMSAIPFGVVGAVWAHLLLGMSLSFLSIFGIIALVGVVVNDSLVLVDYINRRRVDGVALQRTVREAGSARFRPILLTSATTFAGLTPLLLERSLQAQFLVPMAVSLGFGVLFATGVSLVMVPCAYLILEDLRRLVGSLWNAEQPTPETS